MHVHRHTVEHVPLVYCAGALSSKPTYQENRNQRTRTIWWRAVAVTTSLDTTLSMGGGERNTHARRPRRVVYKPRRQCTPGSDTAISGRAHELVRWRTHTQKKCVRATWWDLTPLRWPNLRWLGGPVSPMSKTW